MYSPGYNRIENRAELLAFMRTNNFPILVTGCGQHALAGANQTGLEDMPNIIHPQQQAELTDAGSAPGK